METETKQKRENRKQLKAKHDKKIEAISQNKTRNVCRQRPAVARQAQQTHYTGRRRHPSPAIKSTRLLLARRYLQRGRSILSTLSAQRVFVPGDLDLLLLTLTFQLVWAKDQTRLPCEFGANPFSGSCHPLSNTSPKNRTRFADFAHLVAKPSP